MDARVRADDGKARAAVRAFLDAASSGNVTAVDAYLRSGGDVNAALGEGWTALHGAATHGHIRVLERLIRDAACDLNALTVIGTSALAMALRMGDNIATRVLLDGGASRATIAQEELCRVWDAGWLWADVQRRLHPGWSIVWIPVTHHRFSRQEREKCRLILCINHAMARLVDTPTTMETSDGVMSTLAQMMTSLMPPWWRAPREQLVFVPRRHCSWVYLPPVIVQLVLQYALFLW